MAKWPPTCYNILHISCILLWLTIYSYITFGIVNGNIYISVVWMCIFCVFRSCVEDLAVLLPGFAIKCQQGQVAGRPRLCDLALIRLAVYILTYFSMFYIFLYMYYVNLNLIFEFGFEFGYIWICIWIFRFDYSFIYIYIYIYIYVWIRIWLEFDMNMNFILHLNYIIYYIFLYFVMISIQFYICYL